MNGHFGVSCIGVVVGCASSDRDRWLCPSKFLGDVNNSINTDPGCFCNLFRLIMAQYKILKPLLAAAFAVHPIFETKSLTLNETPVIQLFLHNNIGNSQC